MPPPCKFHLYVKIFKSDSPVERCIQRFKALSRRIVHCATTALIPQPAKVLSECKTLSNECLHIVFKFRTADKNCTKKFYGFADFMCLFIGISNGNQTRCNNKYVVLFGMRSGGSRILLDKWTVAYFLLTPHLRHIFVV